MWFGILGWIHNNFTLAVVIVIFSSCVCFYDVWPFWFFLENVCCILRFGCGNARMVAYGCIRMRDECLWMHRDAYRRIRMQMHTRYQVLGTYIPPYIVIRTYIPTYRTYCTFCTYCTYRAIRTYNTYCTDSIVNTVHIVGTVLTVHPVPHCTVPYRTVPYRTGP